MAHPFGVAKRHAVDKLPKVALRDNLWLFLQQHVLQQQQTEVEKFYDWFNAKVVDQRLSLYDFKNGRNQDTSFVAHL